MPRPGVGNPGNKGGGRKSAYQELADAKRLWELWTNPEIPKILEEKLRKKESLSAEEMHLLRGYQKSDVNLNAIFNKLYPDKSRQILEGEGGLPAVLYIVKMADEPQADEPQKELKNDSNNQTPQQAVGGA